MANRQCEQCKGAIPDRTSRQRNSKGELVCDSCVGTQTPDWPVHSSLKPSQVQEYKRRASEAMRSILRIDQKVAHDSGDNAVVNHCPMCGSGAVTGGSDGTIECGFCHTCVTVQVQPAHPNMPQTIDGQAVAPPGMPAGQETEMSAPVDPAVDEDAEGAPADALGQADPDAAEQEGMADPQAEQDAETVPPQFRQSSKYFTEEGDVLDLNRYLDKLALDHADDRLAVLASVRTANETMSKGQATDAIEEAFRQKATDTHGIVNIDERNRNVTYCARMLGFDGDGYLDSINYLAGKFQTQAEINALPGRALRARS